MIYEVWGIKNKIEVFRLSASSKESAINEALHYVFHYMGGEEILELNANFELQDLFNKLAEDA